MESLIIVLIGWFIFICVELAIIDRKLNKLLRPQTNPLKPESIRKWHDEYMGDCPSCHRVVRFAQKHCHNCIQLLDWSDVLNLPTEDEE